MTPEPLSLDLPRGVVVVIVQPEFAERTRERVRRKPPQLVLCRLIEVLGVVGVGTHDHAHLRKHNVVETLVGQQFAGVRKPAGQLVVGSPRVLGDVGYRSDQAYACSCRACQRERWVIKHIEVRVSVGHSRAQLRGGHLSSF